MFANAIRWISRFNIYYVLTAALVLLWIENSHIKAENGFLKDQTQHMNETLEDKTHLISNLGQELTEKTDQIEQFKSNKYVIAEQIKYISKWMAPIEELENHIRYVMEYCDLKRQESEFTLVLKMNVK